MADSLSTTQTGAPIEGPPGKRIARFRLASWAPVIVLLLLCVLIAIINPNFLSFGNFVRISQAAMIPLVLSSVPHSSF